MFRVRGLGFKNKACFPVYGTQVASQTLSPKASQHPKCNPKPPKVQAPNVKGDEATDMSETKIQTMGPWYGPLILRALYVYAMFPIAL